MNKDYAEMADRNWKNHEKRLEAQNKGRSGWYKHYRVRTAQLEREYEFEREKKRMCKLYLTITTIRFLKYIGTRFVKFRGKFFQCSINER